MLVYLVYLTSFAANVAYCYRKDCIVNKNIEQCEKLKEKYLLSLKLSLFNIVVIGYIGFSFIYQIYTPKNFNIYYSTLDFLISVNCANIMFYFIHRLFHSISYLSKFHRVHHEFKDPIGLRAAYTHPIDYFFGNLLPLGITPFILNTDLFTISVITFLSIYSTVVREHSDYSDNRHHLDHHKYYNCNYGTKRLDKLFGTIRNPRH